MTGGAVLEAPHQFELFFNSYFLISFYVYNINI